MYKIILPHQFGAMELKWCKDKYEGIIPLEGHHSTLIYGGKEYNLCCNAEDFNKILEYCISKDKLDATVEKEIDNLVGEGVLFFESNVCPDNRFIHEVTWVSEIEVVRKKLTLKTKLTSNISLFERGVFTHRNFIEFSKNLPLSSMSKVNHKESLSWVVRNHLKDVYCERGTIWIGKHYGFNYNPDDMVTEGWLTGLQLKSYIKGVDSAREFNNTLLLERIKHEAAKELAGAQHNNTSSSGGRSEPKISVGRWMTGGPKQISVAEYIQRGGKIN